MQNRQSRKLNSSFRALHVNIYAGTIITWYATSKLDFPNLAIKMPLFREELFNFELIFYKLFFLFLFSAKTKTLVSQAGAFFTLIISWKVALVGCSLFWYWKSWGQLKNTLYVMTMMTRAECCKSYGSLSTCKLNCEFPGRVHIVGKYRKYRNTEHKTFAWKVLKSKWPTYNLSHFSNARWLDLKSQRILAFTQMANENPVYSAKCHSALPKTISKNFSASITPKANPILIL